MDRFSDVVQNENGRAVPGATIQILDEAGRLATIYADRAGTPQGNPFTADALGRWSFCAPAGLYTANIYLGGAFKARLPDIRIDDPADVLAQGLTTFSSALSAASGAGKIGTANGGTVQSDLNTLKQQVGGLSNYVLPAATGATMGGVRIGSGLTVDASGVVSLTYSYTLPVASPSVLGGVKIGSGLAVDPDGTISVTGATQGTVTSVNNTQPVAGNVTLNTDKIAESATPTNMWFSTARVLGTVLAGLSTASATAVAATDTILVALGKLQAQITSNASIIAGKQDASGKDTSNGFAGLTGFAINVKNAAGTVVSFIVSAATAARTWTFPDKDIIVAGTTNETHIKPTFKGYIEQFQALNPGATVTLDPLQGTLIELTTTASPTITLPAAAAGMGYTLILKYGGVHTPVFNGGTSIRWANGNTIPTPTSVAGKMDKYVFTCGTGYTLAQDGGRNF